MPQGRRVMAQFLVRLGFMRGLDRGVNVTCLEFLPITLAEHMWGSLMINQCVSHRQRGSGGYF